jgi:hypothetical protein
MFEQIFSSSPPSEYLVLAPKTYTVDSYAISHNGIIVLFSFTVKESAVVAEPGMDGYTPGQILEPAYNETALLPTFNAIVTSIRFKSHFF